MSQLYYGMVTAAGQAKLAASAAGGPALVLSAMAFGDGGGNDVAPTDKSTALVQERYRASVVEISPHPTNASIIYVEGVIPPGVGGWTLREAGIYDATGTLIVIAKTPVLNVALISEGASTEGIVRLPIVFDSASTVQMLVDPTVVLATRGWVLSQLSGGQIDRAFLAVNSVTAAVPAAPASRSVYVVPAAPTGAWAGQAGKIAYYQDGWTFRDAPTSMLIGAMDTGKYWRRTATAWAEWVATDTQSGPVELATNAEVQAGTDTSRAVTPAGLSARTATDTRTGLIELATNAEVQAGTDTGRAVTPGGLSARTATTTRTGIVELATPTETTQGSDAERAVTPAGLKAALAALDVGIKELPNATTDQRGIVELATGAETAAGTDTERAITPAGLLSRTASELRIGLVELATGAEVQAGQDASRAVTPAGLATLLATAVRAGLIELATNAEVQAGADTERAVTPAGLASRTATAARAGLVELATSVETAAGEDVERAVTPAGLLARTASDTRVGLVELATNGETQTGTDAARAVTPAGLSARTATEARTGVVELATIPEAVAGVDTSRAVTPAGLSAAIADANPATLPRMSVFSSSGTWTKTAKARKALVIAQGPGGAGGGDASGAFRAGAGGGAGACAISLLDISGINSAVVTVSAGGVGVANDHGGSGGGNTSFGTLVVASPGQGGSRGVSGQQVVGGLGGQTATAQILLRGASGMHPTFDNSNTAIAGSGGDSFFSGGGRGASNQDSLGPGNGLWGSGGGGADVGGTSPAGAGGNGGQGLLIVVEM